MSFAENLKQIRKERQLSQEELAEMLGVSRQAVSKWEQGCGYPETETLALLSSRLKISLDHLMETGMVRECGSANTAAGTIIITSPHENAMAVCCKVLSSGKMAGGKASPKYALFGVSSAPSSFWGEPTTFLGWYAKKDDVSREILEIQNAIAEGLSTYTLKYSVQTKKTLLGIKMTQPQN